MVGRVGCGLVEDAHRLLVELHEVALERQVCDDGLVLVAARPIVLKEQGETACCVEIGSLDWDLLDVVRLADLQRLCWLLLACRLKVHGVLVQKDLERLGTGRRIRGAEENRVQANLAGEGDRHQQLFVR